MTSSASSSSSGRALLLLAVAALAGCNLARPAVQAKGAALAQAEAPQPTPPQAPPGGEGDRTFLAETDVLPGTAPGEWPEHPRLVLFPIQNLSGGAAPVKELSAAFRARLEAHGVTLVPEAEVYKILAARRVRYTGGLDAATSAALHDEAGADGVIITSLEAFGATAPFRLALTTRLLSTGPAPAIRFILGVDRTGDDAPGVLGLGIQRAVEGLEAQVLEKAAAALAGAPAPRPQGPGQACPEHRGHRPDRHFRSPVLSDPGRRTIAILPFVNTSGRREAGEIATLRFLAPLVASGAFQVVEPGVARAQMLSYRLGASGGISLDDARALLRGLGADLVLTGAVRTFEEAAGTSGAPAVDLTAWVLDRETERLVWSSTSSARGDDGVYFFGAGRISTASGLTCSLAKGATRLLVRGREPLTGADAEGPAAPAQSGPAALQPGQVPPAGAPSEVVGPAAPGTQVEPQPPAAAPTAEPTPSVEPPAAPEAPPADATPPAAEPAPPTDAAPPAAEPAPAPEAAPARPPEPAAAPETPPSTGA